MRFAAQSLHPSPKTTESATQARPVPFQESTAEEGQGDGRTDSRNLNPENPLHPSNDSNDPQNRDQNTNRDANHDIQWKYAIRAAAGVSLLVGLLTSVLAMGSLLWIVGGAVLVIALYRRRFPYALLQARLDARIGLVTGTMTATMAVAGNTLLLVVQRYGLHQGNLLDAALSSTMQQAMNRAAAGSEAQAQMASATAFLLSPEGRAGMVLMGMACIAAIILILSIAGSILGTQFYRNRSHTQPIR